MNVLLTLVSNRHLRVWLARSSPGPFTHLEMQEWYSNGYFDPQLPIKHPETPVFEPLARFLMRYGETSPFLVEAEEVVRVVSFTRGFGRVQKVSELTMKLTDDAASDGATAAGLQPLPSSARVAATATATATTPASSGDPGTALGAR